MTLGMLATLVFLAVDQARLQDLDEAVRRYLAWESIVAETETLNLDQHQEKQAEAQKVSAEDAAKKVDLTAYKSAFPQIQGPGADIRGVRRLYEYLDVKKK